MFIKKGNLHSTRCTAFPTDEIEEHTLGSNSYVPHPRPEKIIEQTARPTDYVSRLDETVKQTPRPNGYVPRPRQKKL